MSLFEEENKSEQHPENETNAVNQGASEKQEAQPPVSRYETVDGPSTRPTTPSGYGQGYPQPSQYPQNVYPPYTPMNYQSGYQQQYRPPQNQYQYNQNGWQQPMPPQAQPSENYQWDFQDYDKASENKTKKKRSRGLVVFVVSFCCVLAIGILAVSGFGVYSYLSEGNNELIQISSGLAKDEESSEAEVPKAKLEISSKPQNAEAVAADGKMTIPQVAKKVLPSVVGVFQYQPDMTLEQTGAGSGIIMSEDGYILTNAHVVAGGTDFKVILADGTPKDADLIGYDTLTDLAVLKALDAENLTPAVFGDSDETEVGETVIAIGNPAGEILAGSVTQGIISAVKREIGANSHIPLIQTDAAINPGNSGGALVNEYGQVIGINSAKIVAEAFEGISFAIPMNEAKPIIDDIIKNGRVTGRVKIGIVGREIDEIDARNSGLQMGIRIQEIDPESDLTNNGVQKFDIITGIDGKRIYTMYELKTELEKHKPGDYVTLSLYRSTTVRSPTFDVRIRLIEDK